jgi:hypothetical protein
MTEQWIANLLAFAISGTATAFVLFAVTVIVRSLKQ